MRTLTMLVLAAAGGYLLLAAMLYFMQERMVFLAGVPGRALEMTPEDVGFAYDDVHFETADGLSLHGWYVPAPERRGTVLFFHGNAGNISHRLESISIFRELGLDTFIIDYRGYGQSEGRPSEEGAYRDAEAAWDYLLETRQIPASEIVIFGRSLGGAVGAWLGARREPAALIVESSFTSAADMAAKLYPFMPTRLLIRLRFPVIDHVAESQSPVLIVHSKGDEIIPYAMGRALYEVAPEPKAFLQLEGGHNGGFWLSRDRYQRELDAFLAGYL